MLRLDICYKDLQAAQIDDIRLMGLMNYVWDQIPDREKAS